MSCKPRENVGRFMHHNVRNHIDIIGLWFVCEVSHLSEDEGLFIQRSETLFHQISVVVSLGHDVLVVPLTYPTSNDRFSRTLVLHRSK